MSIGNEAIRILRRRRNVVVLGDSHPLLGEGTIVYRLAPSNALTADQIRWCNGDDARCRGNENARPRLPLMAGRSSLMTASSQKTANATIQPNRSIEVKREVRRHLITRVVLPNHHVRRERDFRRSFPLAATGFQNKVWCWTEGWGTSVERVSTRQGPFRTPFKEPVLVEGLAMTTSGPTLLYDLNVAFDVGERRNPLRVMRELGIKWTRSEVEPIDQQIRFECCTPIAGPLPPYLRLPSPECGAAIAA
jgi:hypothetical protein